MQITDGTTVVMIRRRRRRGGRGWKLEGESEVVFAGPCSAPVVTAHYAFASRGVRGGTKSEKKKKKTGPGSRDEKPRKTFFYLLLFLEFAFVL